MTTVIDLLPVHEVLVYRNPFDPETLDAREIPARELGRPSFGLRDFRRPQRVNDIRTYFIFSAIYPSWIYLSGRIFLENFD